MEHTESMERPADFYADPSISVTTASNRRSYRIPLLLVLSLMGCVSMWQVCLSMISLTFNSTLFWWTTFFTWAFVSGCSTLKNRLQWLGYLPIAAGVLTSVLKLQDFLTGAKYCYNVYYSTFHHTDAQYFEITASAEQLSTAATCFLCCCSLMLCGLICRAVVRHPLFLCYFLLTFIPVEFGLYGGLSMNLFWVFLLLITWFTVLAVRLSGKWSIIRKNGGIRSGTAASCGIAALALTIGAVLISVFVVKLTGLADDPEIQEKRSEIKNDIENFEWQDIPGSLNHLGITLGVIDNPKVRELGTKSHLEYQQKERVLLTMDDVPEAGVYLKNYTGAIYDDNQWNTMPKDVFEDNKFEVLFQNFGCSPQTFPFLFNNAMYSAYGNMEITMQHLSGSDYLLQPYGAYNERAGFEDDSSCSLKHDDAYTFTVSKMQNFYSITQLWRKDYTLPMSGFNMRDETTANFFRQLSLTDGVMDLPISAYIEPYEASEDYTTQTLQALLTENYAYRGFVYENYAVPVESDGLQAVYDALPAGLTYQVQQEISSWEIMKAIRTYLADTTEYTLSPGITPSTRDFVQYFLLENHKGYCMHYATAGTILARYFGVPARYCEGYVVPESRIQETKPNAEGKREIILEDADSHAWCEIYIRGYGWIPFELTPGYYGADELTPQQPEEDINNDDTTGEATEEETQQATETVTETQPVPQQVQQTTTQTVSTDESGGNTDDAHGSLGGSGILKTILWILLTLALLALAVGGVIYARKKALTKRAAAFADTDTIAAAGQIYTYLMKLLHLHGVAIGNEQLLTFAEKTADALQTEGFDGEAVAGVMKLALTADMSGIAPQPEEVREAVNAVSHFAEALYDAEKLPGRMTMKYMHHLI